MASNGKDLTYTALPFINKGAEGLLFLPTPDRLLSMFGAIAARVSPDGDIELLAVDTESDMYVWTDIQELTADSNSPPTLTVVN